MLDGVASTVRSCRLNKPPVIAIAVASNRATVNVVPGNPSFNGLVTYTGTSKASISIFSVGVKFKLGEPPAVATRG